MQDQAAICAQSMLELTRAVCGAQAEKLREALGRLLRHPDEEAVHDVRVACRRLRVGLRLARKLLGKERVAPIRKHLKELLTTLGEIRDAEVLAARAGSLDHPGGGKLATLLESQTQTQRREAAITVERRGFPAVPDQIQSLLAQPAASQLARSLQEAAAFGTAPRALEKHGEILHKFARLHRDSKAAQLHALRIEMKKLRYTAEFFGHGLATPAATAQGSARPDPRQTLKVVTKAAQAYQELLGELHDAVVAQEVVRRWLGEGLPWRVSTAPSGHRDEESESALHRLLEAAEADEKKLREEFARQWGAEDFRY